MSETVEETPVLETIEDLGEQNSSDSPPEEVKPLPKKEKNPNRVKAGLKLAAIGQRAKEEKMRKRVQDEMIRPSTWVMVGVVLTSVGFLGLYFSPLFSKEDLDKQEERPSKTQDLTRSKSYFG